MKDFYGYFDIILTLFLEKSSQFTNPIAHKQLDIGVNYLNKNNRNISQHPMLNLKIWPQNKNIF